VMVRLREATPGRCAEGGRGGGDVLGSFGPNGTRRALDAIRQVGLSKPLTSVSQCAQLLGLSQRAAMLCHPRIVGSYFA
jgi:hypothetical protein